MTATPLVSVRNLRKEFPVRKGLLGPRQVKVAVEGDIL
jgi:hypothetical protein